MDCTIFPRFVRFSPPCATDNLRCGFRQSRLLPFARAWRGAGHARRRARAAAQGDIAKPWISRFASRGWRSCFSHQANARIGEAGEVASTVLHLAAAESAFIVGTEIVIDGGMSQL